MTEAAGHAECAAVSSMAMGALAARYRAVRETMLRLTAPLAVEDQVVQVIPETSPTKWHLAHTTWFFERFCLRAHARGYASLDDRYDQQQHQELLLADIKQTPFVNPLEPVYDTLRRPPTGEAVPMKFVAGRLFSLHYMTVQSR